MSDDAVMLTESAARKTATAVRKVNGEPLDLTSQDTPTQYRVGSVVWVFVTGNASTGGGHYNGKIALPPTADIVPASNCAAADFGTAHTPTYGKVCVANAPEEGKTTHALTVDGIPVRPFLGTILRRQQDGTTWVGIESYAFRVCEA